MDGIVGLIPAVLATGLVLGTLKVVEGMNTPTSTTSMKDYKIKSLQDMI